MISLIYLLELIHIFPIGATQSLVGFVCLVFSLLALVFVVHQSDFIGEIAALFGEKMVTYILGYSALSLLLSLCFYFGTPSPWLSLAVILLMECGTLYLCSRTIKEFISTDNPNDIIGKEAFIIEWNGSHGKVRYQGEIWNAYTDSTTSLVENDEVTIESVENLHLCVKKIS